MEVEKCGCVRHYGSVMQWCDTHRCETCGGTGVALFCPSWMDKCSGCEEGPCPECRERALLERCRPVIVCAWLDETIDAHWPAHQTDRINLNAETIAASYYTGMTCGFLSDPRPVASRLSSLTTST